MPVDHKRFLASYGTVPLTARANLDRLLTALEADREMEDRRWVAYFLATVRHETWDTWAPCHEKWNGDREAYFESRYGRDTLEGKRLGNTEPGDGARFAGRGFVQLTGRANYARVGHILGLDLLAVPDQALDWPTAYTVAARGMREGWFTSKRLTDYFQPPDAPGTFTGYCIARRIINGNDRAEKIAHYALQLESLLRGCAVGGAA